MQVAVQDIVRAIEAFAPLALQESWDNSGLLIGNAKAEVGSALITVDVTEAVIDEAIEKGCGLVIAHHPLIFGGLKRITGRSDAERAVIKAIQGNVAVYAAHTNIDIAGHGVSRRMAEKLSLKNIRVLAPQKGCLKKLVVFAPESHVQAVQKAMFDAGAGQIGAYDSCSFNIQGTGTFRAGEEASPFVVKKESYITKRRSGLKTVVVSSNQSAVIEAMLNAHPYEEVAYDVYAIDNQHPGLGLGAVADTEEPIDAKVFLEKIKHTFGCTALKYTPIHKEKVSKIAMCGGSGSPLIRDAMNAGADLMITADIKYHQFFDAENRIILVDIGHYESEQFTKELFFEIVTNKFPKFALRLSDVQTNPVNYLF
jgi:dinuclear metal center YbgI/SA1388 family protein